MGQKAIALRLAGIIFGVVSLLHLVRLLLHIPVTIGDFCLPYWISIFGFFATGALCVWLWRLAGKA